ncbi:DUF2247 family protein [Providencia sneebia]
MYDNNINKIKRLISRGASYLSREQLMNADVFTITGGGGIKRKLLKVNDMTLYPIPASSIYSIASLSWCDIKWGYEYKFISRDIPIKKAEESVLTNAYTTNELELSFLTLDGSDVTSFLEELCPACKQEDESTIKENGCLLFLVGCVNKIKIFRELIS